MNTPQQWIALTLAALSLSTACLLPGPARAEDEVTGGRKMLYLFSADFPPSPAAEYPTPPIKETQFWQLLDKEMAGTPDLTLTENIEQADYRVDLRCSGIIGCSTLVVDIKSPKRDVLGSFTLKHFAKPFSFGLGEPNLALVAQQLTHRLDDRLKLIERGGYGHTD